MSRSIRLSVTGLVLAVLVLPLAGCGGTQEDTGTPREGGGQTNDRTVIERNTAFSPAELEIRVGETVTFTNEDEQPHNVSIDGRQLGNQSKGESVTWTAEKAGNYRYLCTIHPSMTAIIFVK